MFFIGGLCKTLLQKLFYRKQEMSDKIKNEIRIDLEGFGVGYAH